MRGISIYNRLNEKEREQILKAREERLTLKAISDRFGVSIWQLQRLLKKREVKNG